MVLEVAILDVKPRICWSFNIATVMTKKSLNQAQDIISSMPGCVSHQLQQCIENNNRYILLVNWQTLEDHTQGFSQSKKYEQWRKLLHNFYEPFPVVEHYQQVFESQAGGV